MLGVISLAVTLLMVPVVKRLAFRLNAIDYPGARRVNTIPVARMGGVAMFVGVIGALDDGDHQQRHREGDDAQHQKVPDICADNHLIAFLVEFDGGLDVALEDVAALLKHDAALAEFLC